MPPNHKWEEQFWPVYCRLRDYTWDLAVQYLMMRLMNQWGVRAMCHHFAKEAEAGNLNSFMDKDARRSFCNEVTRVETTLRQGNQMMGEINIHHRQIISDAANNPNSPYAYNPNKLARIFRIHFKIGTFLVLSNSHLVAIKSP